MQVAVIGAGVMGSGIAQISASAGHEVVLCDSAGPQLDRAIKAISGSLERFVAKDRISRSDADDSIGRIRTVESVSSAVQHSDVVIEAVLERLPVKHEVFAVVLECAPAEALLGTNTSQLSITAIGAPLGPAASRLIGMHFFNPPALMRLVELVKGLLTSEETVERAETFARGLGKETVVCRKDSPGFLTSRISAIVRLECLRMVEEGVAEPEDIDKALKLGLNFPMGPLELGDFNGLDTYLDALESLAVTYGDRFRPTVGLRNLVAAGRLGRKTGSGIYQYDAEGRRVEKSEA
jgi:3-hydroxybutyryl-CoA dehydrogenase